MGALGGLGLNYISRARSTPTKARSALKNHLDQYGDRILDGELKFDQENNALYTEDPLETRFLRIGCTDGGIPGQGKVDKRMYLVGKDREKQDLPGSTLLLSRDEIAIINQLGRGYESPSVEFKPGNPYVFDVQENDYLLMQSLGLDISAKRRENVVEATFAENAKRAYNSIVRKVGLEGIKDTEGIRLIPSVAARGAYAILAGEQVLVREKGRTPLIRTPSKIKGPAGSTTVPMQIASLTNDGRRLQDIKLKTQMGECDCVIGNYNDISRGLRDKLNNGAVSVGMYTAEDGNQYWAYTSALEAFHNLTPAEQEKVGIQAIRDHQDELKRKREEKAKKKARGGFNPLETPGTPKEQLADFYRRGFDQIPRQPGQPIIDLPGIMDR